MTEPFRLTSALADRYRIERELGQGGMATVYLAHDLRHDRKVALKVLKPELAAVLGAERFVVEIKTTAALQHPHILPLFDSGTADGFLFYVMPFIDGETLRSKLDRETQLGLEESVRIASDVASALHYAHEHGVIHRDIKPENILLHDGRPMVADFGIALAVSAAAGGRMTETGLSLGTPHYMSPEQATAEKEITARSDVYSLGSVLYEMLTGEPPHMGNSAQQIIMKIITEEAAPVTRLRKAVPTNVAAAVAKALEKLPADRFESARAFADALGNPGFTVAGMATAPGLAGAVRGRTRDPVFLAVAAVALAGLGVTGWLLTRPAPDLPVSRYSVRMPDGQALGGPFARIAVTPDGSNLIFTVGRVGATGLWVRARDQLEATPLPGTTGAQAPFVSPDGERVGYLAQNALRVVSLRGGPVVTVTDSLVGSAGATWGPDGFIYADGFGPAPLVRVPVTGGGGATWFTQLDSATNEVDHLFPDALPNGKGVLFSVGYAGGGTQAASRNLAVATTATGVHRVLVRGVLGRYAKSGHLVYVTADGSLMAVRFDQDAMEITGEPVALTAGITLRTIGIPDLAIADDGTLVYTVGGGRAGIGEPVWVGRDGRAEPVAPDWTRSATTVALSPDGTQLAVAIAADAESHLWVRDLTRGTASKLTFTGSTNYRPFWILDGTTVGYTSNAGIALELHRRRSDGSADSEVLLSGAEIQEGHVTRDGGWIVFRQGAGAAGNLYARRMSGDTTWIGLATTEFGESSPAVSPDGRWLAYVANEAGSPEVYVRPFPDVAGGKWLVSPAGGTEPVWARNGREVFYRNGVGEMVAVEVLPTGAPPTGRQRTLFSANAFSADPLHAMYDVGPDGRFVMTRLSDAGLNAVDELIVVQHFFTELKARVPR